MPESTERAPARQTGIRYTFVLGDKITHLYQQGVSLRKISMMPEMPPYGTIMKWAKENTHFRDLLKGARATRGLAMEEEALDIAYGADKETVACARLQVDLLMRIAEADCPERYGKKLTHEGNADKPLTFVISTGFPPPNQYQTPPKLGSDGMILDSNPVKEEITYAPTEIPEIIAPLPTQVDVAPPEDDQPYELPSEVFARTGGIVPEPNPDEGCPSTRKRPKYSARTPLRVPGVLD